MFDNFKESLVQETLTHGSTVLLVNRWGRAHLPDHELSTLEF